MDVTFILNPAAGRGRAGKLAAELPRRFARHGLEAEVRETRESKHAIELARAAAESGSRIVAAVGGDGTAHEVVNGLAGTSATLGVVPLGSGNDLAMALGIPPDLDAALDVLVSGRDRPLDLGRFDDGWFANSLGLGFEAQVTIESRKIRHLRGFTIYLAAVVKALAHLECPDLEIRIDDRKVDGERLLVCVGNGPRVGGGFLLTPDADNADGRLDVCVVDAMGRLAVMRTLPKAISGTHVSDPRVSMFRGERLTFASRRGFPFHADGEVYSERRHELTIRIEPGALRARFPTTEAK
ncbi:MAG: diacylglycerol kinase family lipid kinase [bacterium]